MAMTDAPKRGPVELAVIEFPGNQFNGSIIPAIQELVNNDIVRIIDLVVVKKDAEGNGVALELSELDEEEASAFVDLEGEVGQLVNDEDIELTLSMLEPETTAAMVVWEDVWATRLAAAVRASNGEMIMQERIPEEVVELALAD